MKPRYQFAAAILILGALLTGLTGCQPMARSEETLKIQSTEDDDPSELPVINDVYDKSVEADVYGTEFLKLP